MAALSLLVGDLGLDDADLEETAVVVEDMVSSEAHGVVGRELAILDGVLESKTHLLNLHASVDLATKVNKVTVAKSGDLERVVHRISEDLLALSVDSRAAISRRLLLALRLETTSNLLAKVRVEGLHAVVIIQEDSQVSRSERGDWAHLLVTTTARAGEGAGGRYGRDWGRGGGVVIVRSVVAAARDGAVVVDVVAGAVGGRGGRLGVEAGL